MTLGSFDGLFAYRLNGLTIALMIFELMQNHVKDDSYKLKIIQGANQVGLVVFGLVIAAIEVMYRGAIKHIYFKLMLMLGPLTASESNQRVVIVLVSVQKRTACLP